MKELKKLMANIRNKNTQLTEKQTFNTFVSSILFTLFKKQIKLREFKH